MKKIMSDMQTIERSCPDCRSSLFDRYSSGYDFEYWTFDNKFYFVKCRECGLVYLNPTPLIQRLGEVYPPDYKPFHFNTGKKDIIISVRDFLETRKALELIKYGKINVKKLITNRFSLDEAYKAYKTALENRESLKVVVLNQ